MRHACMSEDSWLPPFLHGHALGNNIASTEAPTDTELQSPCVYAVSCGLRATTQTMQGKAAMLRRLQGGCHWKAAAWEGSPTRHRRLAIEIIRLDTGLSFTNGVWFPPTPFCPQV